MRLHKSQTQISLKPISLWCDCSHAMADNITLRPSFWQQVKKHVDNVTHNNNTNRQYRPRREKKTNGKQTKRRWVGLTTSKKKNSSDNERGNRKRPTRKNKQRTVRTSDEYPRVPEPKTKVLRRSHHREEETTTHQVFACILHLTHKIPGSLVALSYLGNHAAQINQLISAK